MTEPTEASPLLEPQIERSNTTEAQGITTLPGTEPPPSPANDHFKRPIKIFTSVIFVASVVDLVLAIVTHLVSDYGAFNSGTGRFTRDALEAFGFFIILALIVSAINLRVEVHIMVNIILDLFLGFVVLYNTAILLGDAWPDYGICGVPGYREREHPQCPGWKLALQILVGIAGGLGVVIGVLQLIIFVLRIVAAYRTRFWQRPLGLFFPTGELTVALTIKVLKQQPPEETQAPAGPAIQVATD